MLFFFLAVVKVSFMRCVGVSAVPAVSEPSKRITLLFSVFESIVCSHLSRRFAMRVGICIRFRKPWLACSCGEFK